MAKLQANVGKITDKDGNAVDPTARSSGNGTAFHLIEPGYALATVTALEMAEYRAKSGEHRSKDKDGKWTYVKLTPSFLLHNENGTIINRQDVTVGVRGKSGFMRPDGDKSKAAIWPQAQYLLGALGLLSKDEEGNFSLDFDTDLIADRVVRVQHDIAGYQKGVRNYDPEALSLALLGANDGNPYTFDDVQDLVAQWNVDNDLDEDNDQRLRLKNVVTGVYPVDEKTIEEGEFFVDPATGAVFTSLEAFDRCTQLVEISDQQGDNDAF